MSYSPARSSLPSRVRRAAPPLVVLVVFGGAWELLARASGSLLLPTASATLMSTARLVSTTAFWSAWWTTHQALLVGFGAATLAAVPAGLALGRWPALDHWIDPHLELLLVVPMSAVMPLVVLTLGIGVLARGVVVCLFALPVMTATVRGGVRHVDRRLIDMARSFGAGERDVWRRVLVPGASSALATALRLGLARSLVGMLSVELLLVAVGLGQLMLRFEADFDAASVHALAILLAAEAVALTALARALERRFTRRRRA